MDVPLRDKIRKLCAQHPDEVVEVLLESKFWLREVSVNTHYKRYDDDTYKGFISVLFSRDADVWVEILAAQDPDDPFCHTFRMPVLGGGESPRVRTALLVLALAIKLDNEEKPQNRPPRRDTKPAA